MSKSPVTINTPKSVLGVIQQSDSDIIEQQALSVSTDPVIKNRAAILTLHGKKCSQDNALNSITFYNEGISVYDALKAEIELLESNYNEQGLFNSEGLQGREDELIDVLNAKHPNSPMGPIIEGIKLGNRQKYLVSRVKEEFVTTGSLDVLNNYELQNLAGFYQFAAPTGSSYSGSRIPSDNLIKFVNTVRTNSFAEDAEEVEVTDSESKKESKARLTEEEFNDLFKGDSRLKYLAIAEGIIEAQKEIKNQRAIQIQAIYRGFSVRQTTDIKKIIEERNKKFAEIKDATFGLEDEEISEEERRRRAKLYGSNDISIPQISGDGVSKTTITNYGLPIVNYNMSKYEHRFRSQSVDALGAWERQQETNLGLYESTSGRKTSVLVSVAKQSGLSRYENGKLVDKQNGMMVVKTMTERGVSTSMVSIDDFQKDVEAPLQEFRQRLIGHLTESSTLPDHKTLMKVAAGVATDTEFDINKAVIEATGSEKERLSVVKAYQDKVFNAYDEKIDKTIDALFGADEDLYPALVKELPETTEEFKEQKNKINSLLKEGKYTEAWKEIDGIVTKEADGNNISELKQFDEKREEISKKREFAKSCFESVDNLQFQVITEVLKEKKEELEKEKKKFTNEIADIKSASEVDDGKLGEASQNLKKTSGELARLDSQLEMISGFDQKVLGAVKSIIEFNSSGKPQNQQNQEVEKLGLNQDDIFKDLIVVERTNAKLPADATLSREIFKEVGKKYTQRCCESYASNFMIEKTAKAIEKGAVAVDLSPDYKKKAGSWGSLNYKSVLEQELPVSAFEGVSFLNKGMNKVSVSYNGDCTGNEISYIHIPGTDNAYVRAILCTEHNTTPNNGKLTRTIYKNGVPTEVECKIGDVVMDENTVVLLREKEGKKEFQPYAVTEKFSQYATKEHTETWGEYGSKKAQKAYNVGATAAYGVKDITKAIGRVIGAATTVGTLGIVPAIVQKTTGFDMVDASFHGLKSKLETECGSAEEAKNIQDRFQKLQIKVASSKCVVTMSDGVLHQHKEGVKVQEDVNENKIKFEFDKDLKIKESFGVKDCDIGEEDENGDKQYGKARYFSTSQLNVNGVPLYGRVTMTEGTNVFSEEGKKEPNAKGKGSVSCEKILYYKEGEEYKPAIQLNDKGEAKPTDEYKAYIQNNLKPSGNFNEAEFGKNSTESFKSFCATKVKVEVDVDQFEHKKFTTEKINKTTRWLRNDEENTIPPKSYAINITPGVTALAESSFQGEILQHEASRLKRKLGSEELGDDENAIINSIEKDRVKALNLEKGSIRSWTIFSKTPSTIFKPSSAVEVESNIPVESKATSYVQEIIGRKSPSDAGLSA